MRLLLLFLFFVSFAAADYAAKDYSSLLKMAGFTPQLLQMHFTLYEGYVKNSNELMAQLHSLSEKGQGGSLEYGALKRRLGWEFDGMRLHELYFDNLGGTGNLDPKSPLYKALVQQFGNFEAWKSDFIATGSIRGIGWAILYLDREGKELINTWINEHDVGHLAGGVPLLVMDVFEHAYMPQFGLNRAKYIDAFFRNINWNMVNNRFIAPST